MKRKSIAALLVSGILLAGCSGQPAEQPQESSSEAQTFTATAKGIGDVTVTLEIQDGKVTGASVDTSNETEGYGLGIGEDLAGQIKDSGTWEIDGISGATITSEAARTAAKAAMTEAGLIEAGSSAAKPGTYTGEAQGAKSVIKVTATIDDQGKLSIDDVQCGDTEYVSETAVKTVTAEIEEKQSLAVDTVSGATLSSLGVINAAADALTQAGADLSEWKKAVPAEKKQGEDVTADILIVGGGTSGLTAALAAKTNDDLTGEYNDLNVVVVEHNGYLGGDLAICGGYVASYNNTILNEMTGVSLTDEEAFEGNKLMHNEETLPMMNESVMKEVIGNMDDVLNSMIEQGFPIDAEDATVSSAGTLVYSAARTSNKNTGYRSQDDGYDTTSGSPWMASWLNDQVRNAGVDVRTETTASGLIVENGQIKGVKVADRNSEYTIYADAVVLCTGYSGMDSESVKLFYPEQEGVIRTGGAGITSAAQKWIMELGGTPAMDTAASTMLGYNSTLGIDGDESKIYMRMHMPWVNIHGERFLDESKDPYIWELDPDSEQPAIRNVPATGKNVYDVIAQDDHSGYIIFDSASEDAVKHFDVLAGRGYAWKADTLEELAKAVGIDDPERFAEVIGTYNSDYEAGKDSVYGASSDLMTPVTKAPFYAVKVSAVNTIANVAVYCDDDTTLLMGPEGERIEGLYGAGGVIGTSIPNAGLGGHVASALSSGAVAGNYARLAVTGSNKD